MATWQATDVIGADLRWATLYDELANSPIGAGGTATQYICVDSGEFNGQTASIKFVVSGTGFTYSGSFPNIQLTGGTITEVQEQDTSNNVLATLSGLAISATAFQAALNTYVAGGANPDPTVLNSFFLTLAYSVTGGAGADLLQGGNLADTFFASTDNDTIDGGAGSNTADYSGLTTPGLFAIIQGGGGTVNKGGANGSDTLTNVQDIVDTGTGRSNGDVFEVDSAENVTANSSNFNYLIELSAGVNVSYGTNFTGISEFVSNVGTNTVNFSSDPNFAYVYGSTGNDTLTLGSGGGYLIGEGGTNVLTGGANATNLFLGGQGGTDSMNGGTGTASNFYFVDSNDQVNGAGAFNAVIELVGGVTVQLGSAHYQHVQEFVSNGGTNAVTVANTDTDFTYLYGGTGNDTLSTGSGGGYLIGEGGTNVLIGGGGLNVFVADNGSGVDTMNGGSGSNVYFIDNNSNVHGAGTFNTVIELQQNASLVLGSAQLGSDIQQVILNSGTNSADFHTAKSSVYLYGGSGNDTLFGGTGDDFLYGGTGTNTFKFGVGWGQDTIEDWTAGTNNQIDLTALSGLGVHAITDLTQTITGGNDVITSSVTGTNSITMLGVGSALTTSSFQLLVPPTPIFDLAKTDQVGTPGLHETQSAKVTLVGQAGAGDTVTLSNGTNAPVTALAGNTGGFEFDNVGLAPGNNALTVQVTNSSSTYSITADRLQATGIADMAVQWNKIALQAITNDASTPEFASRALAMESIAVFNAISAIDGTPGYLFNLTVPADADGNAAAAQAAHDVLSYLYPGQATALDALLASSLSAIPDGQAKIDGIALGEVAAANIIAIRANDGWNTTIIDNGSDATGQWQPTPPSYTPAQAPQWANLTPFAMTSPDQFDPAGPPALTSQAYADAVNKTELLGAADSTTRTADQTQIAKFWNDGAGTYTPPGQWNDIADQVALQQGDSLAADARLFAELNVAEVDAAITAWNTKYTDNTWRPVTVITNANSFTNAGIVQDTSWQSLLNTPNFPEYISGHSTFSAAAADILGNVFGTNYAFSYTDPAQGSLSGITRTFTNFAQAAQEAGESRIYGGIHFEFSNQDGLIAGQQVGDWTLKVFNQTTDTIPPQITFDQPSGFATNHLPVVTGHVTDNLTGVASLGVSVDGDLLQSVAFNPTTGAFSFPVNLPLDGSADGDHVLTFQAVDAAGNTSFDPISLSLAAKAPTFSLAASSVESGSVLTDGAQLIGTVNSDSSLVALSYAFDNGGANPIAFDAGTGAFDAAVNYGVLSLGAHTLTVSATDAAGNTATDSLNVTAIAPPRLTITSLTPVANSSEVGVTFRPEIKFSRAVDPTTLTSSSFFAVDTTGAVIPATVVSFADHTGAWLLFNTQMPGSSTITLNVVGNLIKGVSDGSELDAAGNGILGSDARETFTTVNTAPSPGTSISGIVVDPGPDYTPMTPDDVKAAADGVNDFAGDTWKLPIAGVKVYVLGDEQNGVFTNAQGQFTLNNVPAGDVKVEFDGTTATNAPNGFYFPTMVMDVQVQPGVANTIMGGMGSTEQQQANAANPAVYLPRLQTNILQPLNANTSTVITAPADSASASGLNLTAQQISELSLTVQPGSLVDANGQPVVNAEVGISPVPASLVMDMLPPGLQNHTFDITIQAPGGAVFTQPATLTLPNVEGLAPGEQTFILSFDHTTGRLVIDGTATASADGLTVTSDPGDGVLAPGWHGITDPRARLKALLLSKKQGLPINAEELQALEDATWSVGSNTLTAANSLGGLQGIADIRVKGLEGHTSTLVPLNLAGDLTSLAVDGVALNADSKLAQQNPNAVNNTLVFTDSLQLMIDTNVTALHAGAIGEAASVVGAPVAAVQTAVAEGLSGLSTLMSIAGLVGQTLGSWSVDSQSNDSIRGPRNRLDPSLTLHLSADAWQGDPQITVEIDGVLALLPTDVTASHALGQSQDITINNVVGTGPHEVIVKMKNWGTGGTPDTQRNVYISSVTYNGQDYNFSDTLYGATPLPSASFQIGSGTTTEITAADTAIDTLQSEAAYQLPIMQSYLKDLTALQDIISTYDPTKPDDGISQAELTNDLPGLQNLINDYELLNGHTSIDVLLANALSVTTSAETAILSSMFAPVLAGQFGAQGTGSVPVGELTTDQLTAIFPDIPAAASLGSEYPVDTGDRIVGDPRNVPIDVQVQAVLQYFQSLGITTLQTYGSKFYAVLQSSTGDVQRFSFDPKNGIDYLLAPKTYYTLNVFDPVSGYVGEAEVQSDASGSTTIAPGIALTPDPTPVLADGLAADQAYVIGVDPSIPSNIVAGMSDLAALQAGLFDASKLASATGVVASLALQGEANAIALVGGTGTSAQQQLAFVATGSFGLAIVGASDTKNPIIVSQLKLGGNAVDIAVDSTRRIAAVATGTNLDLVSVADPQYPLLMEALPVAASHVRILDGTAYATTGGAIEAFDIETGALTQVLDVGGAAITGLALDGQTLYSMDSSDTLHVFDLNSGSIVAKGSVTLPFGGDQLFVADGIAYVGAANGTATGGYMTVDVSNPSAPTLLESVDNNAIGGATLALNGSGLGLLGQAIQVFQQGVTNVVDVVSTANANNTGQLVTRYTLPAAPNAVAIGNGIGFIADGSSGLQVLDYKPYDIGGVPPTIQINSGPVDIDPVTPGIQVVEGSNANVSVKITDDLQVRNVELLVNGSVALNQVSYPFDLTAIMPTIAQNNGSTSVTLQVEATDTGGNSTISDPIMVQLVPDTTPLKLLSESVFDGETVSQSLKSVTFAFSKALDPQTVSDLTFQLTGPGGTIVTPASIVLAASGRTVEAVYNTLAVGSYQMTVDAQHVTDIFGNALGLSSVVTDFSVQHFSVDWANPAVGGDWSEAANWSTNAVPLSTDDVNIALPLGTVLNIDTDPVVHNLNIAEQPSITMAGHSLTVTGYGLVKGPVSINNGSIVDNGNMLLSDLKLIDATLTGSGATTIAGKTEIIGGNDMFDDIAGTITNAGAVTIDDSATLTLRGAIDNTGSIAVNSAGGGTFLTTDTASTTLSGGGTITLADNPNSIITTQVQGATLTNVDNTISGAGQIVGDTVHGYVTLALVNEQRGIIDATASNALILSPNSFTNSGLVEATNPNVLASPGGLLIRNTTVDQSGGGTIKALGSNVDLQVADIEGGTLATASGGVINVINGTSILDGTSSQVTNPGSVEISDSAALTLRGAIDNTGSIAVNSAGGGTFLTTDMASTTLSGGGTITLADNPNSIINTQIVGATLTNVDNTISGAGQIVGDTVHGYVTLALVNQQHGIIDATAGNALVISLNGSTNNGLVEATNPNALANPGGLLIRNTAVDQSGGGTIKALGSHVDLQVADIEGGTLAAASGGVINVINGTSIFNGTGSQVANTGSVKINDSATLTLRGAIDNTGSIAVNSAGGGTFLTTDMASTTLSGGGTITLADNPNSIITTQVQGATLTNVDNTISGAGQIVGDTVHGYVTLALVNQQHGIIDQVGGNRLTINTNSLDNAGTIDATGAGGIVINLGGAVVNNIGTLESTGAGGLSVNGPLTNAGLLEANGGNLTVQGAVSGGGNATIAAGTLDFQSTADSNVAFTAATGTLQLDASSINNGNGYSGTISGFTGQDHIDLTNIRFGVGINTTLSYAENANNDGGTLTVSDGSSTAHLTLLGNYATASFTPSDDGSGHLLITDPPLPPQANLAQARVATSALFVYDGAGNDTLFGDTNNDFLCGGADTNTLAFATGWGRDTIMDWTTGAKSQSELTVLPDPGMHAIPDQLQTVTGGNDAIAIGCIGTNSITQLGVGSALMASSFHLA